MNSRPRSFPRSFPVFVALISLGTAGCARQPSADQALDVQLKEAGKSRTTVFPLAGKVLVDGQPPKFNNARQRIVVMLCDPTKLTVPPHERTFVTCDSDGGFVFTSYAEADGVPPGGYAIVFAQLMDRGKRGYLGPDGFKNRYNDPQKNLQTSEFHLDHKAPGKTDYVFDLKVEDQQLINPAPLALTEIVDPATQAKK
jgi:hypothetical protein